MIRLTASGVAALLIFSIAAPAAPAAIQVRDAVGGEQATGFPPGIYLTGTGSRPRGTHSGGGPQNLQTGTIEAEANYGAGFVPLLTYCVEGLQTIGYGTNPPDTVGIMLNLAPLTSNAQITVGDADFIETLWFHAFAMSQANRVNAAAFQAVVWEVVADSSIDLSADQFRLDTTDAHTANVAAQANTWITLIGNGTWTDQTPLLLLTDPNVQDLLTPVPEPGSLAGLALLALAATRRR